MNIKRQLYLVLTFSLFAACSGEGEKTSALLNKPRDAVQEKTDAFIQPRIQAIEKAKGLEDRLKKIEDRRLKEIGAFEGGGE